MVKTKIQASQLIRRLQDHVDGKVTLSPSQVTAAKVLLDRSVPVLSHSDVNLKGSGVLEVRIVDPTRRAPPEPNRAARTPG